MEEKSFDDNFRTFVFSDIFFTRAWDEIATVANSSKISILD